MTLGYTNFAYSLVTDAPSPPDSGTSLGVSPGTGELFPATPFNATVWPPGVLPLASNAEIVTVTSVDTDTFTIERGAEDTTAQSIAVGWQLAQTVTAALLDQFVPPAAFPPVPQIYAITEDTTITTGTGYVFGPVSGGFTVTLDAPEDGANGGMIALGAANSQASNVNIVDNTTFLILLDAMVEGTVYTFLWFGSTGWRLIGTATNPL